MGIRRNTLWSAFSNGIFFLGMLVSQVIIGRNLGPEVLGKYYLIITLNGMVTGLLNMGIGLSNMTFGARKEYRVSELNAASVFFAFCLGGAGMLLPVLTGMIGVDMFGDIGGDYLFVPFAMLPFTIYMLYWNYLMVGLEKIILQGKLTIGLSVLWAGLNIYSVYAGLGLRGLMYSWAIYLTAGFFAMFYIARKEDSAPMRLNRGLLKSALGFGLRGNIGEAATQVWRRLNIFLLNYFHGADAVGVFSVASELNEKVMLSTGPVRNAVAHRISSSPGADSAALTARVSRNLFFGLFIAVLSLAAVSGLLIRLLYGGAFSGAANPLRLLLLGTLTVGVTPVLSVYFIGQLKKPGFLSALAVFNAAVSIISGLAFIPSYGIYGVAASYAVSCIIGIVLLIYFFRKFSGRTLREIFIIRRDDLDEYKKFFSGR